MPKQTFFNLPIDKQENLMRAAKKEFSRVSLHEALVANIVKDAEIPRGSFYQYFEDKEDVYFYLLNQLSEKNHERMIALLKDNNGELFKTLIDSFQCLVQSNQNQTYKNFFKHTFLNMNYKMKNTLAYDMYEENRKNQHLSVLQLINRENLNIQDDRELQHVLEIIASVTFHNFVQLFVKELTNEDALKSYIEQIELLKKGLYKG